MRCTSRTSEANVHNNRERAKTNVDAVEEVPNRTAESDSRAERPNAHRYAICATNRDHVITDCFSTPLEIA